MVLISTLIVEVLGHRSNVSSSCVDGKGVLERVQVGEFGTTTSTTSGVNVYDNGAVYIRRTNDNPIFRGYDESGSQVNSEIDNLGGAFFRANVGITPTIQTAS